MGRHKKNLDQNQSPIPNPSDADSASDQQSESENVVIEELQPHEEQNGKQGFSFDGIIGRASDNLKSGLAGSEKRKYKKKASDSQKGEIQTLMVSLFVLIVGALNIPDDLKPNKDELDAFSVPATNLLLRHVNIAEKLTADVMDVIGMIAAISAYWMRTSAAWNRYQIENQKNTIVTERGESILVGPEVPLGSQP